MKEDVSHFLREQGYSLDAVNKFIRYHTDSPRRWRLFEKYALQVARQGKRYGAKAIMERIRWEEEIENGEDFKIANTFTAMYARVFAWKYPEYQHIFNYREVRGIHIPDSVMAY